MSREPQPRNWHAAFGVGSKHYLWGGCAFPATPITQIDTFDISLVKWQEPRHLQGSLPDSLWDMAVTSDEEHGYSFGGINRFASINNVYEISPRTLQCKEIQPASSYSPPGTSHSAIICFNQKLVVYGGYTDRGRTDHLYIFDLRKSECGNSKLYLYQVHEMRDISRALGPLLVILLG